MPGEKRGRIRRIAEPAILVFGARMASDGKKKDRYRDTLQLPKTSFSMRAGLLTKEPELQARWAGMGLYERLQSLPHPHGPFVFHDGPPYANGTIHMGHLLNKSLKDLVVRSRAMAGHELRFVPGWDCHGLPIEHKVMKELGESAMALGTMEVRERCREYAHHYQKLQAEQMNRLGTLADYDAPLPDDGPGLRGGDARGLRRARRARPRLPRPQAGALVDREPDRARRGRAGVLRPRGHQRVRGLRPRRPVTPARVAARPRR